MNLISSSQNNIIKEVKGLKTRKQREEKQLFFIEGARFIEEALKEKVEISYVLMSEKYMEDAENKSTAGTVISGGHKAYLLSDKLFREISDTENPQGIMAVIKMKKYTLSDTLKGENNFIVILEAVQDPGNMGTIIRTADAAGAGGIILSKGCVDLYNPKVLRSTMGSVFHLPVYFSTDLIEDLKEIKSRNRKVYAAHLNGKERYYDVALWAGAAIIIGNEANGISEEIASYSDILVKIPMAGKAESLNASVAAGLLMYEALRNRTNEP